MVNGLFQEILQTEMRKNVLLDMLRDVKEIFKIEKHFKNVPTKVPVDSIKNFGAHKASTTVEYGLEACFSWN